MTFNHFFILLLFIIFATSADAYKTYMVYMKVDHFSFTRDDTFKLRVIISDNYWNYPNGPIIFCPGGEEALTLDFDLFSWEVAKELGALLVFAEHRYYGQSLPFGEKSFDGKEYFGYLTVEQALADFVEVLHYVDSEGWRGTIKENPTSEISRPIIAMGWSYSGELAVWMRIKYPFVVCGSLGGSAPIFFPPGLTPCNSFYQSVTNAFAIDYLKCPDFVRETWNALYTVTNNATSEEGNKWLSESWKLCKPLSDYVDLQNLISTVKSNLYFLAYYNYPFKSTYPAYPIKKFCSEMTNTTKDPKNLLMAMFKGFDQTYEYTIKDDCLDYTADEFAIWGLQNCMEMATPGCTNGKTDMFPVEPWDMVKYSDKCYDDHKVRPNFERMKIEYGGKRLNAASNIVISNGLLDPWSGSIPKVNFSSTFLTIILPSGAHVIDVFPTRDDDPKDVRDAKIFYKNTFKRWIAEFNDKKKQHYS